MSEAHLIFFKAIWEYEMKEKIWILAQKLIEYSSSVHPLTSQVNKFQSNFPLIFNGQNPEGKE